MAPSGVADSPGGGPDAAEGSNAADHPALRAARWIAEVVFHRFLFAWGLLLLAIAVGLVSAAWGSVSGQEQSLLERLTRTGTVRVLDAAVAVESQSGPDVLMDPGRALDHHDYRFEYLLELSYLGDRPVRRYRSEPVAAFQDRPFWSVVAASPLFRTAHFTVKVDRRLDGLLRKSPDRFGYFWSPLDRPMHALAVEWVSASRDGFVPVRYDPGKPADFLFADSFASATAAQSRGCSIVAGLLLGGLGAFVLVFAVSLLTAGTSNVWIPRVLFCGILLATPVSSRLLQSAGAWLGLPALHVAFLREWATSNDPRSRAGFLEEIEANRQSDWLEYRIDLSHSRHTEVFAFFTVARGDERFASFDEAMAAISAQVAAQMVAMPASGLVGFFKALDRQMAGEDGWDGPFLEGSRQIALDTTRSPNLRSWAISAFCDLASARKDAGVAEAIYQQYVTSEPDVRGYWRSFFRDYARAPSFATDLQSGRPERIRRALELWERHGDLLDDVRPLAPRLKQLTAHEDPDIRKLALAKWNSRNDWEGR